MFLFQNNDLIYKIKRFINSRLKITRGETDETESNLRIKNAEKRKLLFPFVAPKLLRQETKRLEFLFTL